MSLIEKELINLQRKLDDALAEIERLKSAIQASETSDAESIRMYRESRDERDKLRADVKRALFDVNRMRDALLAAAPYIATQSIGCHGDKCREPWCYSCWGDEEARKEARKGMEAFQLVSAAIKAATEASTS